MKHYLPIIKHHFYICIATFFYSGHLRPAPGTWGSLAGLIFSLLVLWVADNHALFLCAVFSFVIGIPATAYYGKHSGIIDDGRIVIDEAVAVMLLMCLVNYFTGFTLFSYTILTFMFFRFFDITKPPPIGYFDKKFKTAFGVMFDDILAAIYACLCLKLTEYLLHVLF